MTFVEDWGLNPGCDTVVDNKFSIICTIGNVLLPQMCNLFQIYLGLVSGEALNFGSYVSPSPTVVSCVKQLQFLLLLSLFL